MVKIKNYNLAIIFLTIFGFLIRLKAALGLDVFADDMLYASQSAGVINAGIISTHSNPPLYFYLTDLAYKVFGYTTFASRFWPLIAGTLLIPIVFLLTDYLFKNKKIALLSAFFVTFSAFLVRMTFAEQSLLVLFFVFSSTLFFLNYLENKKKFWFYLSAAGFGLGMLTKYSTPFFLLAFILFLGYFYEKKDKILKERLNLKSISIFLLVIFFFSIPFLAFNLLIYKDKGILDVYFSRIISNQKSDELYGGLAGQGEYFFQRIGNIQNYSQWKLPLLTDPVIAILAIVGLFFMSRKKEHFSIFFVTIMLLIPFILQSGGSALQKHFAFIPFLLSIPAAFGFLEIKDKIKSKESKLIFSLLVLVGLILSLGNTYGTPPGLLEKSATSELKSLINDKVDENDLLILDSRIYTARSFWLASPNSFVLSSQLKEIYDYTSKLPAEKLKPIGVYYVECALDDCGWGTIKNDQNLNQTTEQITSIFRQNGILIGSISSKAKTWQEFLNPGKESQVYNVYYLIINLPPEIVSQSKKSQSFYFTPYLYENMDSYTFNYGAEGFWKFLNVLSKIIIYISMIFLAIIIYFLLNFFIKQSSNKS